MTLWDLMFRWLKRHRPRRMVRMVVWPYWSKPQRFNIMQRWAMRRGALLVLTLIVLKVNPFSTPSLILLLITGTAVMVEHRVHRRQERALYESKPIVWMK